MSSLLERFRRKNTAVIVLGVPVKEYKLHMNFASDDMREALVDVFLFSAGSCEVDGFMYTSDNCNYFNSKSPYKETPRVPYMLKFIGGDE